MVDTATLSNITLEQHDARKGTELELVISRTENERDRKDKMREIKRESKEGERYRLSGRAEHGKANERKEMSVG